ncbi:hypothetical protein HYH03_013411 [Edaphochlamys debaryana]|uniref:DOMON domain-containing protein n=1 Tax=Edaphochlamys debaryana TaxID=47281 RepID=A0A835XTJ1_9CHLO|nr:hypothetical protein HYH03_013411 [Edaphochlamys debaryana]|eukprot:KAG2487971.1 hypothetical protein HYH03_013411 [Edaphochlamys debaryana]
MRRRHGSPSALAGGGGGPHSCSRGGLSLSRRTTSPAARHRLLLLAAALALAVLAPRGALAASCYRSLSRDDFPHCTLLSPLFALHWRVAGPPGPGANITLGLDADTGGYPDSWLGLGLSDGGGMIGADIIVVAGPVGASAGPAAGRFGGWRALDLHSVEFGTPQRDESQDVTLLSAPLSGPNSTVAVITRPLHTCDPWDRHIQAGGACVGIPQTVSWAIGRRWPSKHRAKGDSAAFFIPEADRLWGVGGSSSGKDTSANSSSSANSNANSSSNASSPATTTATAARLLNLPPAAAQLFAASDAAANPAAATVAAAARAQPAVTKAAGPATGPAAATDGAAATSDGGSEKDSDGDGDAEEEEEEDGGERKETRLGASAALGGAEGGAEGEDPEAFRVEIRMRNVTIPSNQTTSYMCAHFELPSDRRYHITSSLALIESPIIHHIILFACEKPPTTAARTTAPGAAFGCLSSGGGGGCNTFYLGWAPGQTGAVLPPTVGFPVGEADSTVFSLQVHYNNEALEAGVPDASGFSLLLTPRLRPYDAGVFAVGQTAIAIPPGEEHFTLRPSVCPSTCTAARLSTPLRLLASGLHMHTLGRSIVTQHIRNGTELPPLGSKPFYRFDYQSQDPVPLDSSILAPGDVLITTCSYDSTERENVTRYGESTQDEMCFNFVLYYPKNPSFVTCASMDAAGDPSVALCGGWDEAGAAGAALAALTPTPPAAPGEPSVPPSDLQYEPYGRDCPDMSYGLPPDQQRTLVLQTLSDGGPGP